jgi:hypothetical protein
MLVDVLDALGDFFYVATEGKLLYGLRNPSFHKIAVILVSIFNIIY